MVMIFGLIAAGIAARAVYSYTLAGRERRPREIPTLVLCTSAGIILLGIPATAQFPPPDVAGITFGQFVLLLLAIGATGVDISNRARFVRHPLSGHVGSLVAVWLGHGLALDDIEVSAGGLVRGYLQDFDDAAVGLVTSDEKYVLIPRASIRAVVGYVVPGPGESAASRASSRRIKMQTSKPIRGS